VCIAAVFRSETMAISVDPESSLHRWWRRGAGAPLLETSPNRINQTNASNGMHAVGNMCGSMLKGHKVSLAAGGAGFDDGNAAPVTGYAVVREITGTLA
jgi:hypothetical protein